MKEDEVCGTCTMHMKPFRNFCADKWWILCEPYWIDSR